MRVESLVNSGKLVWFEHDGYGYVDPGGGINYGQDYYNEYADRAKNEVSEKLMKARLDFVLKYWTPDEENVESLVDVGCGACAFIDYTLGQNIDICGYDINPLTVHRLIDDSNFYDIWEKDISCATFWDVLEHFHNPDLVLERVKKIVFISIPIFKNARHCINSKHYKPGEHIWYFTERGLVNYMASQGFELLEWSRMEEELGREDIGSYVFKRVA